MKATLSTPLAMTCFTILLGALLIVGCEDSSPLAASDRCPNCNALLAEVPATPQTAEPTETSSRLGITLIGPYTHENLSVYLIAQPNATEGQEYLTLDEAIEMEALVIRETSDVNRLELENTSDTPVFLHSGEIIRGGKQDRMLQYDLIIKPKSGRVPLPVFCVESGRWSPRDGEAASYFTSGGKMGGNAQRLAAIKDEDQSEVWDSVAHSQADMAYNTGAPVAAAQSPSSLELAMDNEAVQAAVAEYVAALEPTLDGQATVIGYAAIINGKIESVDVYESPALLGKLWPKLIKGSAMTAFSQKDKFDPAADVADAADVLAMMETVDAQGFQPSGDVGDGQIFNSSFGGGGFGYELLEEDRTIHRSYLRDDEADDEGNDENDPPRQYNVPGNRENSWPEEENRNAPVFNEQEAQERR